MAELFTEPQSHLAEAALGSWLLRFLITAGALKQSSAAGRYQLQQHADKTKLQWLSASLDFLSAMGFVEHDSADGRWLVLADVETMPGCWGDLESMLAGSALHESRLVLLKRCIEEIPGWLNGIISATEVVFPDGELELVQTVYEEDENAAQYNRVIAQLLKRVVSQRREQVDGIRVIEVGAGTGATTHCVFEALEGSEDLLDVYRFTDVSPAFLAEAERSFGHLACFETSLFDLNSSCFEQGLALADFDVVIAANVLHATRDIRHTLWQLKSILRKNGIVLISELLRPSLLDHVTFGLLEGWWHFNDQQLRLAGSPLIGLEQWGLLFDQVGLGGHRYIRDGQDRRCVLVAESDGIFKRGVGLQADSPSDTDDHDWTAEKNRDVVPEPAVSSSVDVKTIESIRELLTDVLGVVSDEHQDLTKFADRGVDSLVAVKLVNRINDTYSLSLKTSIVFDHPSVAELSTFIDSLHTPLQQPKQDRYSKATGSSDSMEQDGLHEDWPGRLSQTTQTARPQYKRVCLRGPIDVEDIHVERAAMPEIGPRQVAISVRSFVVGFADLLCIRGLYPEMPDYPFVPGMDCCGRVVACGSQVSDFKVGDLVVTCMSDTMASHANLVVVSDRNLYLKPQDMSDVDASLFNSATVAIVAAMSAAGPKAGDLVVIPSATGGIGQSAIQLAQHAGARVIASAGTDEKTSYLASLPQVTAVDHRKTDINLVIQQLSDGRGADLIINSHAVDYLQHGIRNLAPGGTYIEMSAAGLRAAQPVDMGHFRDNQRLISLNIRAMFRHDRAQYEKYYAEMLQLFRQGVLTPVISRRFDFADVREAYRHVADRQAIGKVVVEVSDNEQFYTSGGETVESSVKPAPSRVAVIGMSGRFGSANNTGEFWESLAAGRSLLENCSRWRIAGACDRGSFLHGIESFDSGFFGISSVEADYMDPQQRMFLQECWNTLEDAGYARFTGDRLPCGVFVGTANSHYEDLFDGQAPAQAFWGNAQSVVPARISYYLDLQGPAIAVDTACSSSLVAIDMAFRSLLDGDIEMALAGGVFIQCTSFFFDRANRAGMLSPTGACHTFDQCADGFVPGEAVGAVLLKPERAALRDNDHIYGVIVASGMNQDGSSNGITAPNSVAQARLIEHIYERYSIEPGSISYVEAHGTGTKLGDPVEIAGLKQVFPLYPDQSGAPHIGSVKVNMGHAATAAGIASFVKVLLCLQHKVIVPMAGFKDLNREIDTAEFPFQINTECTGWEASENTPRRAAISGFGFSGTNAHLVVEQAPEQPELGSTAPAWLFPLSARNEPELVQQVKQLSDYLVSSQCGSPEDISYTLLHRRQHWKHRVAVVADGNQSLRTALLQILEQAQEGLGGRVCMADPNGESGLAIAAQKFVERSLTENKFPRSVGRCLSLPTYPLQAKKHWLTVEAEPAELTAPPPLAAIVERLADEESLAFRLLINTTSPMISDHRIAGQLMLPAVATFVLVAQAARELPLTGDLRFSNVIWLRPAISTSGQPLLLNLKFVTRRNGGFDFTLDVADNGMVMTHARGEVEVLSDHIAPLRGNFDLPLVRSLNRSQLYDAMAAVGVNHGEFFRCVQSLDDHADFTRGRIAVAADHALNLVELSAVAWLDAALQCALGMSSHTNGLSPGLPFALDQLCIKQTLPAEADVVVIKDRRTGTQSVEVVETNGVVCASFDHLHTAGNTTRTTAEHVVEPCTTDQRDTMVFFADRDVRKLDVTQSSINSPTTVVLCDVRHALTVSEHLSRLGCTVEMFNGQSSPDETYLADLRAVIRSVLLVGKTQLLQVVVDGKLFGESLCLAVSGYLRSLQRENLQLTAQLVSVETPLSATRLADRIVTEGARAVPLVYVDEQRYVRRWRQLDLQGLSMQALNPPEPGSCYLITGGLGGIADQVISSLRLAQPQVQLALVGRSPAQLPVDTGPGIHYYPCELGDEQQLRQTIALVTRKQGAISGVLHCAGVLGAAADSTVDQQQFSQLLVAKVRGTRQLLDALSDSPLEFFACFSSLAGVFGAKGLAGYATANAWLDGRCAQAARLQEFDFPLLSISWPQWQQGGMPVSATMEQELFDRFGLCPMPAAVGINVLGALANLDSGHYVVMHGDAPAMTAAMMQSVEFQPLKSADPLQRELAELPVESLNLQVVCSLVSDVLGLQPEDIDADRSFQQMGLDSILLTQLADVLNEQFRLQLSPTVFFDHADIKSFVAAYAGAQKTSASAERDLSEPELSPAPVTPDIAIVGMSGEFPGARDLNDFWELLATGRDCVDLPKRRAGWSDWLDQQNDAPATMMKGGFLDRIDLFDAQFFRISPAEAELMDPQQRLLLMYAYRAIEDAGLAPASLKGTRTAVYTATGDTGFQRQLQRAGMDNEAHAPLGLIPSIGPARISYFLDLQGPSEPVETACSSALVAMDKGYRDLLDKRCDTALVGAANTLVSPDSFAPYHRAGMLSPSGQSRPFAEAANGFVRGEGVGFVVLQRLQDCQERSDHIYAIVKSCAVDHAGQSVSFTAPNAESQARVIKAAYELAGVNPDSVSYVEAHGTGTRLGDPIEFDGLCKVFAPSCARSGHKTLLGSVKSNIGHLELAAGMAGMIKVALMLQHRTIVPTLHAAEPNPYIDFDASCLQLAVETQPWQASYPEDGARLAGVSSFGFGGVNAHVLLQSFEPGADSLATSPRSGNRSEVAILLSGVTWSAVAGSAQRIVGYLQRLQQNKSVPLARVARTLQLNRDHHSKRVAFVTNNVEQCIANLKLIGNISCFPFTGSDEIRVGQQEGQRIEQQIGQQRTGLTGDIEQHVPDSLQQAILQWVDGATIEWSMFYTQLPKPVRLPGYAFDLQAYWPTGAAETSGSGDDVEHNELLIGSLNLQHEDLSASRRLPVQQVFLALNQLAYDDLQQIVPGQDIFPADNAATSAIVRSISAEPKQQWQVIAYLPMPQSSVHDTRTIVDLENSQPETLGKLFNFSKALIKANLNQTQLILTVVTRGALADQASAAQNPAGASVHGFASSLGEETAAWSVHSIDIQSSAELAELVDLPVQHLEGRFSMKSGQLCRHVMTTVPAMQGQAAYYRQGGRYVVLGGAGGVGYEWTRYLVDKYKARVAWIGRSRIDTELQQRLSEIQELGNRPVYVTADATDVRQLERAIKDARTQLGGIDGVVHSITGEFDEPVAGYTNAAFARSWRNKISSSVNLTRVVDVDNLDFCLFFSSMASLMSEGGMTGYAAGVAFQDEFSAWLNERVAADVRSVNWGVWEVGTGSRVSTSLRKRMTNRGIRNLEPQQALTALERELSGERQRFSIWAATSEHDMKAVVQEAEAQIVELPDNGGSMLEHLST